MDDGIDVDNLDYYWAIGKGTHALTEVIQMDGGSPVETTVYDHTKVNRVSFNLALPHPEENFNRVEPSDQFWNAVFLASPLCLHLTTEVREKRLDAIMEDLPEYERNCILAIIDLHNERGEDLWMDPRLKHLYRYAMENARSYQRTLNEYDINGEQDDDG